MAIRDGDNFLVIEFSIHTFNNPTGQFNLGKTEMY